MSHVEAMLDAYPKDLGNVDRGKLAGAVKRLPIGWFDAGDIALATRTGGASRLS